LANYIADQVNLLSPICLFTVIAHPALLLMHRCGLENLFSSPQLLSAIADGAIIRPDHPTDNSADRHS
jgi:hypothetical protein